MRSERNIAGRSNHIYLHYSGLVLQRLSTWSLRGNLVWSIVVAVLSILHYVMMLQSIDTSLCLHNDHIYLHLYVLSVCVQCDDDDCDDDDYDDDDG